MVSELKNLLRVEVKEEIKRLISELREKLREEEVKEAEEIINRFHRSVDENVRSLWKADDYNSL